MSEGISQLVINLSECEYVSSAGLRSFMLLARAAFIAGVPTALSYDVGTCGSRTGVVYEMLDAQLFSALIRATPDRICEHGALLARIAHTFHSKQADPSIFPDLKARLHGDIQSLRGMLPDDDVDLLAARLETIPDGDSLVHYDLHTSNIMIRNGEPMIIDLGDLSRGHYFFDVGLLAMIFGYEEHGNCEFVTKIPNDTGLRLYEHFIDAYFAVRSAEDRTFFDRNQAFLASLRLISSISILPPSRDILIEKVRNHMLPKIRAEARVN